VLLDLSLAVEVRDPGALVRIRYRTVEEVFYARGLCRVRGGDPVAVSASMPASKGVATI
jgi:hypothetical protein